MIDVYVLNKNLEQIGIIDSYTSLIWANRYKEIGDCELYIEGTKENLELLKKGNYLSRHDDDMVCRIETVELDTDVEDGNYIIVTGYDVKKILDQRVIWGQSTVDGNVENYIRNLVYNAFVNPSLSARQIRNEDGKPIFFLGNKANFKEVTSEQNSYSNIGVKIREFCNKYSWGYKVISDVGNFYFLLYKGNDLSDYVVFSSDYENLMSTKYKEDASHLGNVALIAGSGEGYDRSRNVAGYAESLDRHEIYVDAKDVSNNISWAQLIAMYPTTDAGGQGYIYKTGANAATYRMNYIDVAIVDNNQLAELKINYPESSGNHEITINGILYYRIYDAIIADLQTYAPTDTDTATLRPLVYEIYLLNRGYEKLSEYNTTISFEGSVDPNTTFIYKKDYHLGDLVTVKNEYGVEVAARIVEVIEVNDDDGYTVEPKFEYIEINKPAETVSYLLAETGERIVTEDNKYLVLESNGIKEEAIPATKSNDTKVTELGSKKISELPETDDTHNSVWPIVVNGETRKVTYDKLKEHLDAEIGGARDYEELINKPQINDVTLSGNKAFKDLNLNPVSNLEIEDIFKN